MDSEDVERSIGNIPESASSDELIDRLVVDELYWDSRIDASKVQVRVDDGVVTLTGDVATHADRYAAEADARYIAGVVTVQNQLKVTHPHLIPDHELTANVSTMLDWTPDVNAADIEISAHEGTVTLKGTVRIYWEKLRAHLLTSRLDGVHHVVDEIVVTPRNNLTDREIAHLLTRALERRMPQELPLIQITVDNGTVILRGAVSNSALHQAAKKTVSRTVGVTGIHDELRLNTK